MTNSWSSRLPSTAVAVVILCAVVACSAPANAPDSTGSVAPSPTDQPSSARPDAAGWERIVIEEYGFAIQLPPMWEAIDLTDEDLAALGEDISSTISDEELRAQVQSILQSGGALFALDNDATHSTPTFRTNLNVIVEQIPATMTLDEIIQLNRDYIVESIDAPVDVERIDQGTHPAALLTYSQTTADDNEIHQTQLYMVVDGKAYYVTLSRPNSMEELHETTLDILASFEILP